MLNAMRDRASGFFAKIILALLILSFAAWGIGDMFRSGNFASTEVARVGDVEITYQMVEREMQRDIEQVRGRLGASYTPELMQQLLSVLNIPKQAAARLILEELLYQESRELGLIPGDEATAAHIHASLAFQTPEGAFDKNAYLQALRQMGISERNYVKQLKREMATELLKRAVSQASSVPDIATAVMLAISGETREVTLYAIPAPAKLPEPSKEDLQAFYEETKAAYIIPEYRRVSYVQFSEKDVNVSEAVTDADIERIYNERIGEFTLPERLSLDQLLYAKEEDAKQAYLLLTEKNSVPDVIAKLPPINKADTAITNTTHDRLPEAIRDAVTDAKPGMIGGPVQSAFGWHVFKIKDVFKAGVQPLEEVAAAIRHEAEVAASGDLLTRKANRLEDALAGGSTLAEAAKELGLTVSGTPIFDKTGAAPDGKKADLPRLNHFARIAFETEENASSQVVLGAPGTYFLVHVDKVQPESAKPLESVIAQVKSAWLDSEKAEQLKKNADRIAAALNKSPVPDSIIGDEHLSRLAKGSIARGKPSVGNITLPDAMSAAIFATPAGSFTPAEALNETSYIVAHVGQSTFPAVPPPESLADNKEAEAVRNALITNQQQEIVDQYYHHYLFNKYHVVVHEDVIDGIGKTESQ